MAQLAIKGHLTRGKEVIQLLEMLGGKNPNNVYSGRDTYHFYFIDDSDYITTRLYENCSWINLTYKIFTLEQFEEKFPYKVGDKVLPTCFSHPCMRIITKVWWDGSDIIYLTENENEEFTANELQPYKEETMDDKEKFPYEIGTRIRVKADKEKKRIATIIGISYNSFGNEEYEIKFDGEDIVVHYPTELMIPIQEEQMIIDIPKGYKFVDTIGGKIVLERIEESYPKTYAECCKVVNASPYVHLVYDKSDGQTYSYDVDNLQIHDNLRKLKICRDAYWKIVGEEMGLGKPGEPDYTKDRYIICRAKDEILKGYNISSVLEFPTEKIRDAFYENFKDLIEQCKELL